MKVKYLIEQLLKCDPDTQAVVSMGTMTTGKLNVKAFRVSGVNESGGMIFIPFPSGGFTASIEDEGLEIWEGILPCTIIELKEWNTDL